MKDIGEGLDGVYRLANNGLIFCGLAFKGLVVLVISDFWALKFNELAKTISNIPIFAKMAS